MNVAPTSARQSETGAEGLFRNLWQLKWMVAINLALSYAILLLVITR